MSKKKGRFLSGLFFGGLIGSLTALLYAPQDGEKTRKWIKTKKEENQDKIDEAKKIAEETGRKVANEGSKVKNIIEKNLNKIKKTIKVKKSGKHDKGEGDLQ